MKLISFFWVAICLGACITEHTQNITLSIHQGTLKEVFREIRKQTGYDFVYPSEAVYETKKIDIELKNASLQQVLQQCLQGTMLTYTIVEKTIVISIRKKERAKPDTSDE